MLIFNRLSSVVEKDDLKNLQVVGWIITNKVGKFMANQLDLIHVSYLLSIFFDCFHIFIQMWCYFPWSIMIVKDLLWLGDSRLYSDNFLKDRENEKKMKTGARAKYSLSKGPENNVSFCHITALFSLCGDICRCNLKVQNVRFFNIHICSFLLPF